MEPIIPSIHRTKPESPDTPAVARALVSWHRKQRRDLPWRSPWDKRPSPYAVLVSEVMLQQTQVTTVIPYFERFMAAFPTITALAQAGPDEVMRLWKGLGYYRRAQRLQACAQAVVTNHQGELPDTYDKLLALPGLGEYTAGAVASIAFGQRVPAVDGNVCRVLARLDGIDQPIDTTPGKAAIRETATQLVQVRCSGGPGMLNESLMELGATLCTPRSPQCLLCPVAPHCSARRTGQAEALPIKGRRKDPVAVEHHVVLIRRGAKLLVRRRPDTGLWANMWEVLTLEENGMTPDALTDWVADDFGILLNALSETDRFTHRTTHRLITFVVWQPASLSGRLKKTSAQWMHLDDASALGMAKPMTRVLQNLDDK